MCFFSTRFRDSPWSSAFLCPDLCGTCRWLNHVWDFSRLSYRTASLSLSSADLALSESLKISANTSAALRRRRAELLLLLLVGYWVLLMPFTLRIKYLTTLRSSQNQRCNYCRHASAKVKFGLVPGCDGCSWATSRHSASADILLPGPGWPQSDAHIPCLLPLPSSLDGSSNVSVRETDYRRYRRWTPVDVRWPTLVGSGCLLKCNGNRTLSVPAV